VKKVSLNELLNDTSVSPTDDEELVKWTPQPGGREVDRFTDNGTEYVLVEFKSSPGRYYLYLG